MVVRNELASVDSSEVKKQSWRVAGWRRGQASNPGHNKRPYGMDCSGQKQWLAWKQRQEAKSDKCFLKFLICLPFKRLGYLKKSIGNQAW